jgi:hypothetical protein
MINILLFKINNLILDNIKNESENNYFEYYWNNLSSDLTNITRIYILMKSNISLI